MPVVLVVLKPSEIYIYMMCIIVVRDIQPLYIRQLDKLRRELDDDMETASDLCVVLKPSEIYIYMMCIIVVRDIQPLYIRQLDNLLGQMKTKKF
jgi:uncharacterized membrane protein